MDGATHATRRERTHLSSQRQLARLTCHAAGGCAASCTAVARASAASSQSACCMSAFACVASRSARASLAWSVGSPPSLSASTSSRKGIEAS